MFESKRDDPGRHPWSPAATSGAESVFNSRPLAGLHAAELNRWAEREPGVRKA